MVFLANEFTSESVNSLKPSVLVFKQEFFNSSQILLFFQFI